MDLYFEGLSIAIGLTFQSLSWLFPFRKQDAWAEILWDIAALICLAAFGAIYTALVGAPLSRSLGASSVVAAWYQVLALYPWVLILILNIALGDFLSYWAHRALHSKLLWHSHAWHHSSKHVWWMAGLRSSPIHVALTTLPFTIAYLIFPLGPKGNLFSVDILFAIANQHWLHSNIRIPYSRWVEILFVTPRYHFVHHSADVRRTDTNYSFVFTWDRWFGTYTDPKTVAADEQLGLDYENSNWRFLLGLPPRASAGPAEEPLGPTFTVARTP